MRGRLGALLALGAAISLVAAACGGGGGASPSPSAGGVGGTISLPGGIRATNHWSASVSGQGSAQIEASNGGTSYFFSPTVLTGTAGQKLTVTVKNTGDTEHNFSIDSKSISKNIQPGQQATVTVTLPTSGSLVFYCVFHKSLGMAGELTAD